MSILFSSNDCLLIDHYEFISKIYTTVSSTADENNSYTFIDKLFYIVKNEKKKMDRKRKLNTQSEEREVTMLKTMFNRFKESIPKSIRERVCKKSYQTEVIVSDVRELAQQLFESNMCDHRGISGGNSSDNALICRIKDECFIIPPKSSFFCGCVKEKCRELEGKTFDIVVADPPWWNKYIRRLKSANNKLSYSMMYNEEIASIPIKNLLSKNCVIAVWCTNSPSNIAAMKNLIFPKWGVEYVATWYWLKVTTYLEPMCSFGTGSQKQPYERLILGKVGHIGEIPDCQLILSVPSALHSHKPPLTDLLNQYLSMKDPQILELFARYLLPNTTSLGFEPLKWQHISLYKSVT